MTIILIKFRLFFKNSVFGYFNDIFGTLLHLSYANFEAIKLAANYTL